MTTAASVQSSDPRQGVVARHPLVFFFLLTFVLTEVMRRHGLTPAP
jgi:hypothetical protein